ncbi:uncharacterized protein IL334_001679 [Kwoniella shivajii]|uniref:Uncharacterized protein n=1 Tax=Kwoniella shivajii TaxID=564305 RepID=A0ABZ1CU60_9TREE|nr:hypothetical protein IL334_001679 [Kwoniella shivajii]
MTAVHVAAREAGYLVGVLSVILLISWFKFGRGSKNSLEDDEKARRQKQKERERERERERDRDRNKNKGDENSNNGKNDNRNANNNGRDQGGTSRDPNTPENTTPSTSFDPPPTLADDDGNGKRGRSFNPDDDSDRGTGIPITTSFTINPQTTLDLTTNPDDKVQLTIGANNGIGGGGGGGGGADGGADGYETGISNYGFRSGGGDGERQPIYNGRILRQPLTASIPIENDLVSPLLTQQLPPEQRRIRPPPFSPFDAITPFTPRVNRGFQLQPITPGPIRIPRGARNDTRTRSRFDPFAEPELISPSTSSLSSSNSTFSGISENLTPILGEVGMKRDPILIGTAIMPGEMDPFAYNSAIPEKSHFDYHDLELELEKPGLVRNRNRNGDIDIDTDVQPQPINLRTRRLSQVLNVPDISSESISDYGRGDPLNTTKVDSEASSPIRLNPIYVNDPKDVRSGKRDIEETDLSPLKAGVNDPLSDTPAGTKTKRKERQRERAGRERRWSNVEAVTPQAVNLPTPLGEERKARRKNRERAEIDLDVNEKVRARDRVPISPERVRGKERQKKMKRARVKVIDRETGRVKTEEVLVTDVSDSERVKDRLKPKRRVRVSISDSETESIIGETEKEKRRAKEKEKRKQRLKLENSDDQYLTVDSDGKKIKKKRRRRIAVSDDEEEDKKIKRKQKQRLRSRSGEITEGESEIEIMDQYGKIRRKKKAGLRGGDEGEELVRSRKNRRREKVGYEGGLDDEGEEEELYERHMDKSGKSRMRKLPRNDPYQQAFAKRQRQADGIGIENEEGYDYVDGQYRPMRIKGQNQQFNPSEILSQRHPLQEQYQQQQAVQVPMNGNNGVQVPQNSDFHQVRNPIDRSLDDQIRTEYPSLSRIDRDELAELRMKKLRSEQESQPLAGRERLRPQNEIRDDEEAVDRQRAIKGPGRTNMRNEAEDGTAEFAHETREELENPRQRTGPRKRSVINTDNGQEESLEDFEEGQEGNKTRKKDDEELERLRKAKMDAILGDRDGHNLMARPDRPTGPGQSFRKTRRKVQIEDDKPMSDGIPQEKEPDVKKDDMVHPDEAAHPQDVANGQGHHSPTVTKEYHSALQEMKDTTPPLSETKDRTQSSPTVKKECQDRSHVEPPRKTARTDDAETHKPLTSTQDYHSSLREIKEGDSKPFPAETNPREDTRAKKTARPQVSQSKEGPIDTEEYHPALKDIKESESVKTRDPHDAPRTVRRHREEDEKREIVDVTEFDDEEVGVYERTGKLPSRLQNKTKKKSRRHRPVDDEEVSVEDAVMGRSSRRKDSRSLETYDLDTSTELRHQTRNRSTDKTNNQLQLARDTRTPDEDEDIGAPSPVLRKQATQNRDRKGEALLSKNDQANVKASAEYLVQAKSSSKAQPASPTFSEADTVVESDNERVQSTSMPVMKRKDIQKTGRKREKQHQTSEGRENIESNGSHVRKQPMGHNARDEPVSPDLFDHTADVKPATYRLNDRILNEKDGKIVTDVSQKKSDANRLSDPFLQDPIGVFNASLHKQDPIQVQTVSIPDQPFTTGTTTDAFMRREQLNQAAYKSEQRELDEAAKERELAQKSQKYTLEVDIEHNRKVDAIYKRRHAREERYRRAIKDGFNHTGEGSRDDARHQDSGKAPNGASKNPQASSPKRPLLEKPEKIDEYHNISDMMDSSRPVPQPEVDRIRENRDPFQRSPEKTIHPQDFGPHITPEEEEKSKEKTFTHRKRHRKTGDLTEEDLRNTPLPSPKIPIPNEKFTKNNEEIWRKDLENKQRPPEQEPESPQGESWNAGWGYNRRDEEALKKDRKIEELTQETVRKRKIDAEEMKRIEQEYAKRHNRLPPKSPGASDNQSKPKDKRGHVARNKGDPEDGSKTVVDGHPSTPDISAIRNSERKGEPTDLAEDKVSNPQSKTRETEEWNREGDQEHDEVPERRKRKDSRGSGIEEEVKTTPKPKERNFGRRGEDSRDRSKGDARYENTSEFPKGASKHSQGSPPSTSRALGGSNPLQHRRRRPREKDNDPISKTEPHIRGNKRDDRNVQGDEATVSDEDSTGGRSRRKDAFETPKHEARGPERIGRQPVIDQVDQPRNGLNRGLGRDQRSNDTSKGGLNRSQESSSPISPLSPESRSALKDRKTRRDEGVKDGAGGDVIMEVSPVEATGPEIDTSYGRGDGKNSKQRQERKAGFADEQGHDGSNIPKQNRRPRDDGDESDRRKSESEDETSAGQPDQRFRHIKRGRSEEDTVDSEDDGQEGTSGERAQRKFKGRNQTEKMKKDAKKEAIEKKKKEKSSAAESSPQGGYHTEAISRNVKTHFKAGWHILKYAPLWSIMSATAFIIYVEVSRQLFAMLSISTGSTTLSKRGSVESLGYDLGITGTWFSNMFKSIGIESESFFVFLSLWNVICILILAILTSVTLDAASTPHHQEDSKTRLWRWVKGIITSTTRVVLMDRHLHSPRKVFSRAGPMSVIRFIVFGCQIVGTMFIFRQIMSLAYLKSNGSKTTFSTLPDVTVTQNSLASLAEKMSTGSTFTIVNILFCLLMLNLALSWYSFLHPRKKAWKHSRSVTKWIAISMITATFTICLIYFQEIANYLLLDNKSSSSQSGNATIVLLGANVMFVSLLPGMGFVVYELDKVWCRRYPNGVFKWKKSGHRGS